MNQTSIRTLNEERALAERRASKAAADIMAFDKAAEAARRLKDPAGLEAALIGKLNAQRDFATQYVACFPHGGPRPAEQYQDASTGVLDLELHKIMAHPEKWARDTKLQERIDWCAGYNCALRSVQRWCELLEVDTYAEKKNAVFKRCWELAELWQAANYSSASNEWYTPAKYLEAVREVLGDIDLDPASSEQANATVQARKFFNIADNGLELDWFGRVFMNPPYGKTDEHRSLAAAFCNKAISEFNAGNIDAGIILVNSLHSQMWQAPLYDHVVCFVDHRIHFVSADGEENENPTFQNIFVYLGHDAVRFAKVFSRFGYVMRKA